MTAGSCIRASAATSAHVEYRGRAVAAIAVRRARAGKKSSPGVDTPRQQPDPGAIHRAAPKPEPSKASPPPRPAQGEKRRQNLRIKVTYDEAKIDRLIEFERAELKRKGEPEATVEELGTSNRAMGTGEPPVGGQQVADAGRN